MFPGGSCGAAAAGVFQGGRCGAVAVSLVAYDLEREMYTKQSLRTGRLVEDMSVHN